ncbi:MAG: peptide-methionine (S)-S-oxide reductase MsrA [Sphingobacterium sp.]
MEATFGGGCFWCTEVIFQHTKGVEKVLPGYMGGRIENPTYEQVCMGNTDHVEGVRIEFDESQVSFQELLEIFFKTHDPTTLNRQGGDVGTQYRSVVFFHNDKQRQEAENFIGLLEREKVYDRPIVTAVEAASTFWLAENYHHDYFNQNPENQYCQAVIAPKLQKFLSQYRQAR